jgi:DNA-binding response OmpR family regulator
MIWILVVEDDYYLTESLTEALTMERYEVECVKDGEVAWRRLQKLPGRNYDLIIMDITLPKLDGIRLCQNLRNHGCTLPILMLTARDTISDKITGLDAGADSYMVKPFNLQELMAQVRALLRRGKPVINNTLTWGDLSLDFSKYEVLYGRKPIHLTPKEFALMEALLRCNGRISTRSSLIDQIWGSESPPEEETIKTYIRNLRAKLINVGAPKDLIETIHGVGYRLKCLGSNNSSKIS